MKKFMISLIVLLCSVFGIYFVISSKPPSPIITVEGKKVGVVQGTYCWEGLFNNECADTTSPPELIKHKGLKATIVSPESDIKIEFKTKPNKNSMGVNQWLQNGEPTNATLNGNVITAPKEEGVYVYDVFARWDKGSSSYAFIIQVQ